MGKCQWASVLSILMLLFLAACEASSGEDESQILVQPSVSAETQSSQTTIEDYMEQMTLRDKVGQLFMVRPDALDPSLSQEEIDNEKADGVKALTPSMEEMLADYPVGGICQFGKNIDNPDQIQQFNEALQAASTIPLLIAVDEEGGRVARLAGNPTFALPQFESAAAVGASGNPDDARQMGQTIGQYLRQYGFTMDFAPVADVATNPDNPVIGDRAFSDNAATVADMADAMAAGLAEQGVLPTFKHFPGHGDTAEDSHSGLAYTYRTAEEMRQCEWIPFLQAAKKEGTSCAVMVGHIAAPALGNSDTPASLSHKVVTACLRQDLFAGRDPLVVTDSLSMGAITESYTPAQACIQALQAGCDILLMPGSLTEAFDGVVKAVEDGTISESRLETSVLRILRYKEQYAGLQIAAER